MKIRQANPTDAKQIALVHVDSWKSTYQGIIPDDYLRDLSYEKREQKWSITLSKENGTKEKVFVAEDAKKKVIGFASGGPIRENVGPYQGELYCMYILFEFQKQGIGTRLFQNVVQYLVNLDLSNMLVWVLEDNPSSKFYEKRGGIKVKEKTCPIGDIDYKEVAYGWDDIEKLL